MTGCAHRTTGFSSGASVAAGTAGIKQARANALRSFS